ncbi:MAG: molybdenum cofactor guanylyltransferase [Rubrobacteraceae bacterium]
MILAGGGSRRMGRDKLSLEVGKVSLLERVEGVLQTFCSEVVVAGDGGPKLRGVRRVHDSRPGGQGPLAGLEAGLKASRSRVVFAAAGDMPFLSAKLALHLCGRVRNELLGVAPVRGGRTHPLCAAYDREVLADVSAALDGGERSIVGFLSTLGRVEYVEGGLEEFGDPGVFLMNVNTPEDLERARSLA